MKQIIKVKNFEDKVSKNGKPYTRFNTDVLGWCSCFESAVSEELKKLSGLSSSAEVEIVATGENDKFKNIRQIWEIKEDKNPIAPVVMSETEFKNGGKEDLQRSIERQVCVKSPALNGCATKEGLESTLDLLYSWINKK